MLFEWNPPDAYRSFRLTVPTGFKFIRAVNAASCSVDEGVVTLDELLVPGYCGVYLAATGIREEVISRETSLASLIPPTGPAVEKKLELTTVRPKIEFGTLNSELVLSDGPPVKSGDEAPALVIPLKHTGIGSVTLEIKCSVKGKIVSRNQDLIREVLRRVLSLQRGDQSESDLTYDGLRAQVNRDTGLEVDVDPFPEEQLGVLKDQLMDYLAQGKLPEALSDEEELQLAKSWLERIDMKELNDLFREQLFHQVTRQILEGIGRYPSDFTEIAGGPATIQLMASPDKLMVSVRYLDSKGNDYGIVGRTIEVKDLRKNRDGVPTARVVPIRIEVQTDLLKGLTA